MNMLGVAVSKGRYFFIIMLFSLGPLSQLATQQIVPLVSELDEPGTLESIETEISEYRHHDGTKIVRSTSDFHILTDVGIDELYDTFADRDAQADILPRVLEYHWEPLPALESEHTDAILETQLVGVQFMGFDGTYRLRNKSELIDRRDRTPQRVLLRYEMIESLDGKLESSSGMYLLEETTLEGDTYTYIRQRNITEFRDTFFGLKAVLRGFTPRDTRRMFEAIIEEARTRQAP
jgi:hypothetical protein